MHDIIKLSNYRKGDSMEQKIIPIVECYDTNKEYLYNKPYLFIKGFAEGRNYRHTLRALPLARYMHDGQFRKGLQEVDVINHVVGENGNVQDVPMRIKVHLPYVLHCLKVCSTLISLNVPMTHEELDVLYTCALLHDTLEDAKQFFPKNGEEYVTEYGFPPIVKDTIRLLSKHSGSSKYELNMYFNAIKKNKFALLIKLADRSHNVEDLYNMKDVPKYINETRTYFLLHNNSIVAYGKQHYPELSNALTVLKSKILSLTEATECMMMKQDALIKEKDDEIEKLKKQIEVLQLSLSKK